MVEHKEQKGILCDVSIITIVLIISGTTYIIIKYYTFIMYTPLYVDCIKLRMSKITKEKHLCLQFLVSLYSLWKMNGMQKEWKEGVSKPLHSSRKCDGGYYLKRHIQIYLGISGGKLCSPECQIGYGGKGEEERILKQLMFSSHSNGRTGILFIGKPAPGPGFEEETVQFRFRNAEFGVHSKFYNQTR